ncbi:MAG: hypothetical protein IPM74_09645 [Crocinitomicaceae bacterium]|nr:hypothetical protein [Crocinitomicaceae bacterium]MBK8926155.1 hypothetical protein [Crocinitomicaceae bacterium]
MKSKFMAGLVASIICLVFVVVDAILLTAYVNGDWADRLVKTIAFATIGLWVILFQWLKPKTNSAAGQNTAEKNQSDQTNNGRNSYR